MHPTLSSARVRIAAALCFVGSSSLALASRAPIRSQRHSSARQLVDTPPRPAMPGDTTNDALIANAIDRDPFSIGRQKSVSRIDTATPMPAVHPVSNNEVPRLIGTVVDASDRSFVLCQLGAAAPRVLRVGQELGGYRLQSITQGAATFVTDDGQRLELRVPKTGS